MSDDVRSGAEGEATEGRAAEDRMPEGRTAEDRTPEDRTPEGRTAEGRTAEGRIEVKASGDRVWRALTEAAELERWFPLEAKVEPGPGGRIWMSWGNEFGAWSQIEAWDPPHHLRVSWSFGGESPQVTDYRLEGRGGSSLLRVVTSGFPADASWDDMVEGTRLGWAFELAQLRHYLERHEGEERQAVYLRRRVADPREEAWRRLMAGVDVDRIAVDVLDRSPPWQLAGVAREPDDALIRLTIDPSHTGPERRDVTVWISAWGPAADRLDPVARRWSERLGELFPEGTALDTTSLR